MDATAQTRPLSKGGLLLRDGATFATLSLVSVALFGITFLLFRSFENRRAGQSREWSAIGETALKDGRPEEAITALRTALSFEPNNRIDQFELAQALAASGRTEEATNYFLNLWEAKPGDGFLNLQLARLARKRGDKQAAVTYYRAAIFGSWEGDGVQRRRETRLELADYFTSLHDASNARMEILIAAGNAPEREDLELAFGDKLRAVGDTEDALKYYSKAIQEDPLRETALERAGRTAYALGRYDKAANYLNRALTKAKHGTDEKKTEELTQLVSNSQRLVALDSSRELPAKERSEHLMAARSVAQKRMQTCSAQATGDANVAALKNRWAPFAKLTQDKLERDAALQDTLATLVDDTERATASACGQPEGDDALLLTLANRPESQ